MKSFLFHNMMTIAAFRDRGSTFKTIMLCLLLVAPATGTAQGETTQLIKIEAERLPDLNVARGGHSTFCTANGELLVAGGHTQGFVPTATAEYFSGGKWHLMNMVYTHDNAMGLQLSSGKVLLAGGSSESLGIGQTFTVEMYDPQTHSFTGFGCLDHKRTQAGAIEVDSGQVIIAGNWYADDAIELFDGVKSFRTLKQPTVNRVKPLLFRTSDGDVLIVGYEDERGNKPDSIVVDRLHGDAFAPELLQTWKPMAQFRFAQCSNLFIGDETKGDFSYLMPVQNFERRSGDALFPEQPYGEVALALVHDTVFTLLPTVTPIPMSTQVGGTIFYNYTLVCDHQARRAYLSGSDRDSRLYVVRVDYAQRPAPLTLYYTDPVPECNFESPILTADGDLAIVGGCRGDAGFDDNFFPGATAWLIHLPHDDDRADTGNGRRAPWGWLGLLLLIVTATGVAAWRRFNNQKAKTTDSIDETDIDNTSNYDELMQQIRTLFAEQRPYLNSELKLQDVAASLGTNSRYISACINQCEGCSFTQYVNSFRVDYAKQLLREQPDMKIATLSTLSGFSGESSFFRIFKAATGTTPREWKEQNYC